MKTQQKYAHKRQRNRQRRSTQRAPSLSLYQHIKKSWVINTLIVPILITLLSVALTLLLAHGGK